MNNLPNINYIVKHSLCTGCGVCKGACPTDSIQMKIQDAKFLPEVNMNSCINKKGCHRCYDICSGIGVNLDSISKDCFSDNKIEFDYKIGRFLKCFTGYSTDHDIRYHASSGGVLSQFLIFLLEKKYISGAAVTCFDAENPLLVNSFIATTKDEILSAKGSKYSPVNLGNIIEDIKKREGKFVIVGLPCHIHSFRKYEKIDRKFKDKVIGYLGLYCSSGKTFKLTEYVFREKKIKKSDLSYFAYRDEGCLGNLVAKGIDKSSSKEFIVKEVFENYYPLLRSFFIPRRCLLCIDYFAELADISFGDIHVKPYLYDKIGINSLVVRNMSFLKWLEEAKDQGYLHLDDLSPEVLLSSQRVVFQKKNRTASFIKIDRLLGRPVPIYNVCLKDKSFIKSFISYSHTMIQIFVGKRPYLWFIIDRMKKKPKFY